MTWRSRHLAWRRNWWLIAALTAFSAGMLVLMGTEDVVPYTQSRALARQTRVDGVEKQKAITQARGLPGKNIKNPVDVFDRSIVHTLSITMTAGEYAAMITDYQRDGLKTWHPATVVIDGVTVNRVGVRLKGNSTLFGLRYSGPESPPSPGGIAATVSVITSDEPYKMPFLLRFDEFVPGQRYQGVNELALRTSGGFGADSTQLTEFVVNQLTMESGQPFLRNSTAGMSFNGLREGYYLLVEHPDDHWADRMIAGRQEPPLYKAIVGASFRYLGDDPGLYAKVFNQQSESRDVGPEPMIRFLRFIETSSDPEFAEHLDERLDVKGFARYLAFHNIFVDPDSLAGTGNNYYWLYDLKTRRMTIASWDQNLAFGRLGFGGTAYRPYYEDGSGIPSFVQDMPGLEELIPGGAIGEPNLLVTRFLETPKFRRLYDTTYRSLFEQLMTSGRVEELLWELATVVTAANGERALVDPDTFAGDIDRNLTFIADRIAYLETVAPIAIATGGS